MGGKKKEEEEGGSYVRGNKRGRSERPTDFRISQWEGGREGGTVGGVGRGRRGVKDMDGGEKTGEKPQVRLFFSLLSLLPLSVMSKGEQTLSFSSGTEETLEPSNCSPAASVVYCSGSPTHSLNPFMCANKEEEPPINGHL